MSPRGPYEHVERTVCLKSRSQVVPCNWFRGHNTIVLACQQRFKCHLTSGWLGWYMSKYPLQQQQFHTPQWICQQARILKTPFNSVRLPMLMNICAAAAAEYTYIRKNVSSVLIECRLPHTND